MEIGSLTHDQPRSPVSLARTVAHRTHIGQKWTQKSLPRKMTRRPFLPFPEPHSCYRAILLLYYYLWSAFCSTSNLIRYCCIAHTFSPWIVESVKYFLGACIETVGCGVYHLSPLLPFSNSRASALRFHCCSTTQPWNITPPQAPRKTNQRLE